MGKLFGTDGIRGRAGEYPLDAATIEALGRALPRLGFRRLLIGRDTRASGPWIESLLREAVARAGGQADSVGVVSTPGVAFLTHSGSYNAGIVISASHNPYRDNGIKIFSRQGVKLSDEQEEEIERLLLAGRDEKRVGEAVAEPADPAAVRDWNGDCVEPYLQFLEGVAQGVRFDSLHVVLDCAHGAAFRLAPEVFRRLGARVTELHVEPDGRNINLESGALFPEKMAEAARERNADLGIAFDGDADRAIFADATGRLLDGDSILYILARYLKEHGLLDSAVVSTVMANIGLELALKQEGLQLVRTQVGDRYVLEEMLRGGHRLGGEQSGHVIVEQYSRAGDGILTGILVCRIVCEKQEPLGRLPQGLQRFPQILLNVPVRKKEDFSRLPATRRAIEEAQSLLGERGRVVVRYSGTEPLVRIMVEGEKESTVRGLAEEIAGSFRRELG